MNVVVRRVGPEAADDVLAVVRQAFGARPDLDPPADAEGDTPETIAADLAAYGGLLATLDGRPVGTVLFKPLPEAFYLRRFGVVPDVQGYGVAGALVEGAVDAAIGHTCMGVLAREELPETVAFWERHGFEEAERRSPYVELRRPLPTTYDAPDAESMRAVGARVAAGLRAGDLVVLTGELGAGKTTFTQGLGEGLGVRGGVTSPTFVIARVHPSLVEGPDLVHVDAYRLGGIEELDDLDLDTSLDTAVTVVEWGAGLAEGLSEQRLDVVITRALADEVGTDDADPRRVELRRVV
ncbi:tRNA (adenosine(37)-N6)-threonylcarbamoyltransferase complex ATPase subunit type 1 TsaE [Nocardioides sediminis]|uniref:tRNA (adenosine(37)-N6)-threonylcarbamoyltransferase complex ATPase subunit type 1 TsaE n=1 Tax=Nocardioides sediminis TaxID=433648 RepID=UPI000D2F709F|nr:tRNA (adenosine(37)-N6)-threonylcarbamoyltransferase complex ATPase subunit type 1 TsaE [Nocardioides sediminis]